MHVYGIPVLDPKAILLRSGHRGHNFRRVWLPKRQFLNRFRAIVRIFLGSLLAAALQIARHNVSCNIASCKTQEEEEQQQQQHQQQQQQQQFTCERWYVLQHLVLQIAAAALANRSSSSSSSSSGSNGTSRQ